MCEVDDGLQCLAMQANFMEKRVWVRFRVSFLFPVFSRDPLGESFLQFVERPVSVAQRGVCSAPQSSSAFAYQEQTPEVSASFISKPKKASEPGPYVLHVAFMHDAHTHTQTYKASCNRTVRH